MEQALDKLIEFVEHAAPQLWAIAVRQAQITAIYDTLLIILIVVLMCLFVRWISRVAAGYDDTYDWEFHHTFAAVLGTVSSAIGLLWILRTMPELITALFNPEYQAIEILLEMVK